jgi:hypothetical protein
VLPGRTAPEGRIDPRWRAMFAVKKVMLSEPELVWPFILRWGRHRTRDLRAAVGCVLLEHLIELHGDEFFPRVRAAARENRRFADTVETCWPFGPQRQRRRLARLQADIRRRQCGSRR